MQQIKRTESRHQRENAKFRPTIRRLKDSDFEENGGGGGTGVEPSPEKEEASKKVIATVLAKPKNGFRNFQLFFIRANSSFFPSISSHQPRRAGLSLG